MTIEEALKQAVEKRDAKRKAKANEFPNRINEFLKENLPTAIAEDKPTVTIGFDKGNVSEKTWDDLVDYYAKDNKGHYRKNLFDIIVADVYKPYLSDYSISASYLNPITIKFYLEQD